ncbi:hypothetical protein FRX31_028410 [Thalictrum thalictroides]|uniref:Uncharacterized protein n=1 Tax=Thalictrum thalictroides TaxID=46969 RepID=A0A7J6VCR5_THATH|nr:hypothetical protein FRX31_028410 [Thalictrum thalictroides]
MILGFRCHQCRKRISPICPYLQDGPVDEVQLHEKVNPEVVCVKDVYVAHNIVGKNCPEGTIFSDEDTRVSLKEKDQEAEADLITKEKQISVPWQIGSRRKVMYETRVAAFDEISVSQLFGQTLSMSLDFQASVTTLLGIVKTHFNDISLVSMHLNVQENDVGPNCLKKIWYTLYRLFIFCNVVNVMIFTDG